MSSGFHAICVCFCAVGFAVLWATHRIEDVNVKPVSAKECVRHAKNPGDEVQRRKGGVKKGRKGGGEWNRKRVGKTKRR